MVLKNWKKVTQNKTFTTWQRGKDEDMFVTVIRQTYNPQAWGWNKPSDYVVTVGTCSTKSIERHCKTKSQAMGFARRYMMRK